MGRVLPKYLCEWTTKKVEEEGVHVIPNNTISKIELEDNKVSLSLKSGEKVHLYSINLQCQAFDLFIYY